MTRDSKPTEGLAVEAQIFRIAGADANQAHDVLAPEEPLVIRLVAGDDRRTLAITLRSPGHDIELAAGYLYGEGIIRDPNLYRDFRVLREDSEDGGQDVVEVELTVHRLPQFRSLDRHVFTSSACGYCGRTALSDELLADVRGATPTAFSNPVPMDRIYALPESLAAAQKGFADTGGLHAAALYDLEGRLLSVREDIGRHNALDKLFGAEVLAGRLTPETPLAQHLVLLSGRAGFELVQKSLVAGVPILCSVSAPSSLAAEVARDYGLTLIGFLRGNTANVYSGLERIQGLSQKSSTD